ncbi:hypothetical protein [Candidatus Thiodictyon syntrophicum]|nr:hypothetical protein [Candidatus Thiodictyon syntrophicum]
MNTPSQAPAQLEARVALRGAARVRGRAAAGLDTAVRCVPAGDTLFAKDQ